MKQHNRKSQQVHQFSQVPRAEIQRSSFDRSHGVKTTFDSGYLIPILVDEVLPGDSFNVKMTGFARMATPIHPIMDNVVMETFFFAVPNRLLWDNWERFNGAQDNPDDSTDYVIPVLNSPSPSFEGSLGDYFGLPTGVPCTDLEPSVLPFRAYNLIWNEWFRDQNLQDSAFFSKEGSEATIGNYPLRRRGKRHDYFTSCLPWPQKGDPVTVPLTGNAPVYTSLPGGTGDLTIGQTNNLLPDDAITLASGGSTLQPGIPFGTVDDINMYANLSSVTGITINELREAFQIQRLLERDARGGTRYIEIIKSHFGVTSPDARLQRPEYLGGGRSYVNIAPVASTYGSQDVPQGNLAAVGTASLHGHGFNKSFTEHCIIIGLVSVRADLTYQQGLNRMWSRKTRFDFYWPALAHLGEQAVLNKEIYADGSAADDDVFGYQERYAEYRYKPSVITGKFRSSDPQSLDVWHLAQDFADLPVLGAEFIEENPPIDRVVAIPSEPHFIFDAHFQMRCARPMPLYGVPGLIDHF